ncbi:Neuferricin [Psilocybe cubensis]|uniref:Cytochrome b5 heme-binding domain-containing protein n=2 Tax=Psilocybe cubensis TaxID=181762 RepID=A0A8H8CKQ6_PSICU|nr:Neuferricin [Psilocybe cubensis]KAH9482454.1 Neuferricin [Psilocybe cubensis]
MSWISELSGGQPPPKFVDNSTDKVKDPSIPGRMVSTKSANRPFLAHREYREKQEALHAAWLEKKKIHDEKIAKGEKVEPLEPDPTAVQEVGLLGLLKFIVIVLVCIALAGKFFTGSFMWESNSKWLKLDTYFASPHQRLFSEKFLAEFNGKDGRPLYLAIDGDVFDVSKGKAYQPGGSYHHFVGIDAARAFGTGCFQTHRTHDTRGMSEKELASLAHWKKFYAEHKDYVKVGRVNHPPIDPSTPIPEHCDPKKAKAAKEAEEKKRKAEEKEKNNAKKPEHEEL